MHAFQSCLQKCRSPVTVVEQTLNVEMNKLQERLQRCSMGCQDKIDALLPAGREPNGAEQEKIKAKLMSCVNTCADDGMGMLAPNGARRSHQAKNKGGRGGARDRKQGRRAQQNSNVLAAHQADLDGLYGGGDNL